MSYSRDVGSGTVPMIGSPDGTPPRTPPQVLPVGISYYFDALRRRWWCGGDGEGDRCRFETTFKYVLSSTFSKRILPDIYLSLAATSERSDRRHCERGEPSCVRGKNTELHGRVAVAVPLVPC